MTENSGRFLLAPHLGPWPPLSAEPSGPCFYLSWPGWEEFLAKRLNFSPGLSGPAPLRLPDDPEDLSLAALDQLADRAGRQGAGLWPLLVPPPGDSSRALAQAIRLGSSPLPRPLLSDRAYLALWTLSEAQAASGAELWAEAGRKERAMWAALKGEAEAEAPIRPPRPTSPDSRTAYAWRCWRRLAAAILKPGDLILPTAPPETED